MCTKLTTLNSVFVHKSSEHKKKKSTTLYYVLVHISSVHKKKKKNHIEELFCTHQQ